MEKIPSFLRNFSKKESAHQRQETAEKIKLKRAEYFGKKKELQDQEEKLKIKSKEEERQLDTTLEKIDNLKKTIEELSKTGIKKFFNCFKLKKLLTKESAERLEKEILETGHKETNKKLQEIYKLLEPKEELKKAKLLVDEFYEEEKERWSAGEYTKEEIEQYFSEEHLSQLSIDDYILLLRRFPKEMVAHVTRQGIRDHMGHMFHDAGLSEYTDSFMKMLEGGRLLSPLAVVLANKEIDQAIIDFLQLGHWKNKEEALSAFDGYIEGSDTYADRSAIHFATEDVADAYYGGETGNEIFIVYPSAFIASQYYFWGRLQDGGGGDYWNDQRVWTNENKGISLDAGIVFIPAEAKVDQKTGSRYKICDGKPIKNEKMIAFLKQILLSEEFGNFIKLFNEIKKTYSTWDKKEMSIREQKIENLKLEFSSKLNISNPIILETFLDYVSLDSLNKIKENDGNNNFIDELTEKTLTKVAVLYEEAENAITSKEFWENYFSKNPERRPSKIVYYLGTNPTKALLEWRKQQKIGKEANDQHIGFSEHNVSYESRFSDPIRQRFVNIALKIIDDYYKDK